MAIIRKWRWNPAAVVFLCVIGCVGGVPVGIRLDIRGIGRICAQVAIVPAIIRDVGAFIRAV
jgi:hypothetical protein